MTLAFGEPTGQGWTQLYELLIAFGLSLAIGFEREAQQKAAGIRTYTLVGLGSALFVLISKYGFTDVLGQNVSLDPSRVAAQIVSGLGFIGAGLIFVRRDTVRGLTTAASVWLTAAVGAAAGAGLPVPAVAAVVLYYLVMYLMRPLAKVAHMFRPDIFALRVSYLDGRGVLRTVVDLTTKAGYSIEELNTVQVGASEPGSDRERDDRRDRDVPQAEERRTTVDLSLVVAGRGDLPKLTAALSEVDGVLGVRTGSARSED